MDGVLDYKDILAVWNFVPRPYLLVCSQMLEIFHEYLFLWYSITLHATCAKKSMVFINHFICKSIDTISCVSTC